MLLEAVVEAREEFTMAAVGAVVGPMACRRIHLSQAAPQRSRALIGVEAEPTHFAWMIEHFRDNGLDVRDHELIEAAAAGERGQAWFYKAGTRRLVRAIVVRDASLREPRPDGDAEINGERSAWCAPRPGELLWRTAASNTCTWTSGRGAGILSGAPAVVERQGQARSGGYALP